MCEIADYYDDDVMTRQINSSRHESHRGYQLFIILSTIFGSITDNENEIYLVIRLYTKIRFGDN